MIIKRKRKDLSEEMSQKDQQGNPPMESEEMIGEPKENVEMKNTEETEESPSEPANESSAAAEESESERQFRELAQAFAIGRGLPAEELEEALAAMKRLGEAWTAGKPTVEMLELTVKGLDYDRAVSKAIADGELRGRNMQIEQRYMKPVESDGLPHPSGRGGGKRDAGRMASIFDLARNA